MRTVPARIPTDLHARVTALQKPGQPFAGVITELLRLALPVVEAQRARDERERVA